MRHVASAAASDEDVWRTFWRTMNLLEPPSALLAPEFVASVPAAANAEGPSAHPQSDGGPTRTHLERVMGS